jgi:glucose-6-phosphate 1-epimerase
MHIPLLDPNARVALEQLVKAHDFLKLVNSKDYYPHSKGSGLPLLLVNTELCSAVISLQGAHLLEFASQGSDPLLWLSPNCDFTPGTPLRGGVPLCVPWFGPHPTDKSKPKHGFARNIFWQLGDAHLLQNGDVELEFLLVSEANELFPYDFSAELRMHLGQSASLELTINNTDTDAFDLSWAMHHYYRVDSAMGTRVLGLAETRYKDNLDGLTEKHQAGELIINSALDRVYPDIANTLRIESNLSSIDIEHTHCPSVIVWNPGPEAAAKMADIGDGQDKYFLCVERGAVLAEALRLEAGFSNTAKVTFRSKAPNTL